MPSSVGACTTGKITDTRFNNGVLDLVTPLDMVTPLEESLRHVPTINNHRSL
jgi:hypothetical protein